MGITEEQFASQYVEYAKNMLMKRNGTPDDIGKHDVNNILRKKLLF